MPQKTIVLKLRWAYTEHCRTSVYTEHVSLRLHSFGPFGLSERHLYLWTVGQLPQVVTKSVSLLHLQSSCAPQQSSECAYNAGETSDQRPERGGRVLGKADPPSGTSRDHRAARLPRSREVSSAVSSSLSQASEKAGYLASESQAQLHV